MHDYRLVLAHGRDEWLEIESSIPPVEKIDDLKFLECPLSVVTQRTWQILELVNMTTDAEGNILHLPFPGGILQQPPWYLEGVKLVKAERSSAWYREMQREKMLQK